MIAEEEEKSDGLRPKAPSIAQIQILDPDLIAHALPANQLELSEKLLKLDRLSEEGQKR